MPPSVSHLAIRLRCSVLEDCILVESGRSLPAGRREGHLMTRRIPKIDIEILPWLAQLIGSSLKSQQLGARGPSVFFLYFSDPGRYFKQQCTRGVGVVRVDLETSHSSLYNRGIKQNPEEKMDP